jgi:hypothetical protein
MDPELTTEELALFQAVSAAYVEANKEFTKSQVDLVNDLNGYNPSVLADQAEVAFVRLSDAIGEYNKFLTYLRDKYIQQ